MRPAGVGEEFSRHHVPEPTCLGRGKRGVRNWRIDPTLPFYTTPPHRHQPPEPPELLRVEFLSLLPCPSFPFILTPSFFPPKKKIVLLLFPTFPFTRFPSFRFPLTVPPPPQKRETEGVCGAVCGARLRELRLSQCQTVPLFQYTPRKICTIGSGMFVGSA